MGDTKYRMLETPDDALTAYRTQQNVEAARAQLMQLIEVDALNRLKEKVPGSAFTQFAGQLVARTSDLNRLTARAKAMRELAGEDPSADGLRVAIEQQIAQEEELHVRAVDQAEYPDAYGLEPAAADLVLAYHEARVAAFHAALDDLKPESKE